MKLSFLFVFFIFINTLCVSQELDHSVQQIQVDVVYLASDLLQGRETGMPGEAMAAGYIVSRFEELGLKSIPGEDIGWYQPFDFNFKDNPHAVDQGEKRTGRNVLGYIDNGAASAR